MSRSDILRFYAVTPVWFWPVLWWNLRRLDARMAARMAAGESGLAEIFTNGNGRLGVRWIARVAARWHLEPDFADLVARDDPDAWARAFASATGPGKPARIWRAQVAETRTYPTSAPLEPG